MLTSALWSDDVIVWEYIGKWRLTSRNDVMTSEFHQNHRKCLYYQYLTCVQIWTHLDNFEIRNIHFCDFGYNMENPIHFLPTSDKCGIKSFLCMHSCQFFQKTCKTKSNKKCQKLGPSARANFEFSDNFRQGGPYGPPPVWNRVKLIQAKSK